MIVDARNDEAYCMLQRMLQTCNLCRRTVIETVLDRYGFRFSVRANSPLKNFYSQVRVTARTCVVTTYKLEYDSHALTQRTATFNAHRTKRLQGQIILAQSDLEHCEQELHKHCGGVRPYNLNFSRR